MAHPLYHARSSAKQFGGVEADYYGLHTFFDQTKACLPTNLHRLVLHNDFGIEVAEQIYGPEFRRPSDGEWIPTSKIGRQHVIEDFGFIPTLSICLSRHPLHQEERTPVFVTQEEQAERLARTLGGVPEDYHEVIAWFRRPGELLGDPRFFELLGNSFGIFLAEARFGISVKRLSDKKVLPTRYIAEQLVELSLGHIPTLAHFFRGTPIEAWMCKGARRLSEEFDEEERQQDKMEHT
jgi:hypothetical protein